jgi:hypothetical protein
MASHGALHVLRAVDTAFEDDRTHADGSLFIPSASWKGSKPGYVFKTGDAGLGYYRESDAVDADQQVQDTKEEAGPSKRDAAELLEVGRIHIANCACTVRRALIRCVACAGPGRLPLSNQ